MTNQTEQDIKDATADVTTPIQVTPTTLPDQLFALMRQLTLIVAGASTVLAFVKVRDIVGLIDFLRSSAFIPEVVAALGLAALVYGNLKTLWTKKNLILTAAHSPDRIAQVVDSK